MKINPINNPNILKTYAKNQSSPTQRKQVGAGLDEVTFSQEALSFAKTLAEVRESMPEINTAQRQARLEELKARVRSGEYHVDSADVADKMIADILSRYQD